ncbi:MAG: peptidoglycan DD-metalloendopeptidase family protein [Candidatus Methylumidiphilus sp.]
MKTLIGILALIFVSSAVFATDAVKTATGMYYPTEDKGGYLGWLSQNKDYNYRCHLGKDFNTYEGNSVYAVTDGKVFEQRTDVSGYGGLNKSGGAIIIEHKTSDGTTFYGLYGHVKNILVNNGQIVFAGQKIADIGPYENVPHLHFGINTSKTIYTGYTDNSTCKINGAFDTKGFIDPVSYITTKYPFPISLKDFWIKSGTILENQKNGFDAQFKLVNNSNSAVTLGKVALTIHKDDVNKTYVKDMKLFSPVTIKPGETWLTQFVPTDSPPAGNYLVIAKTDAKNTNQWINFFDQKPLKVTSLSNVGVVCTPTSLNVGATGICAATAYYADKTNSAVTAASTWSSSKSQALTVSGGNLTAQTVSSDTPVTVTATYNGTNPPKSGSTNVTVLAPKLSRVDVSCLTTLTSGSTGACTASAVYSNGSVTNVTVVSNWVSSNTTALTVSGGNLIAKNVSSSTTVSITASYGGLSSSKSVIVKPLPGKVTGRTPATLTRNVATLVKVTGTNFTGTTVFAIDNVVCNGNYTRASSEVSQTCTAQKATPATVGLLVKDQSGGSTLVGGNKELIFTVK